MLPPAFSLGWEHRGAVRFRGVLFVTHLLRFVAGSLGLCGGGGPESSPDVLVHSEIRQGEPAAAVPGTLAALRQGSSRHQHACP